jgi:hypothetical protein
MIIHTVYKPEENVDYLEDWLLHHTLIGVTHFYLYDNGGAHDYPNDPFWHISSSTNKYGVEIKYTVEEARIKQQEIFKKYPVTVIPWQNQDSNGKLLYNQIKSVLHFKKIVKKGLCAFIDIDEFIIKTEEFKVCTMQQRKFKSRHFYNSVYDCYEVFDTDTSNWAQKVILDMGNFPPLNSSNNIHFTHIDLPKCGLYFNHYNHTEASHHYYLNHMPQCVNKSHINQDYTKIFKTITSTGLLR